LFLAEQDSAHPTKMEEVYMGRWQKRVPLVAASGRAYVTFLNKLRADSFDAAVNSFSRGGFGSGKGGTGLTMEELKALSRFINITTGRANLGASNLSDYLFAPRWMVSRFATVLGTPLRHQRNKYGKIVNHVSPRMRKYMAYQYVKFALGFVSLYGLAALALGDDADEDDQFWQLDPRSTDFGKLRIGNTRLDMMAGLSQPIVFMARYFTGTKVNSRGEVQSIRNSGEDKVPFGADDAGDILWRFAQSKAAPHISAVMNWRRGENVVGETYAERGAFMRDVLGLPAEIAENPLFVETLGLATPLSIRDFYDALLEHGLTKTAALQTLATLGVSMNTYDTKPKKKVKKVKQPGPKAPKPPKPPSPPKAP